MCVFRWPPGCRCGTGQTEGGRAAITLDRCDHRTSPLFPLNAVLFPGLVMPLNIFEERYRAMMRDLLKTDESEPRRFVVVAIRDGHEVAPTASGMPDLTSLPARGPSAGFGTEPLKAFHQVGCVADATTIRERQDGSFEVLGTGTSRVRLLSVDTSGPYLTAEVEAVEEDSGEGAGALAEGVLRAFRSYQKRLAGARERSLSTGDDLPDEPSVVSYLVARRPSWTSRRNSGCSRPRTR